jgi:hypothetical protein
MTPTVALLSLTTDVIMQIQMAGLLGRVPCAASALVNITCSEMELFRAFTDSPEVDTPYVPFQSWHQEPQLARQQLRLRSSSLLTLLLHGVTHCSHTTACSV